MTRLFRIIDWIIYVLGRGRRRAWCEITGGHDNEILASWAGQDRAHAIKLHCFRCDRETAWLRVPLRSERKYSVAPSVAVPVKEREAT